MSGGHWDYAGHRIQEYLQEIGRDRQIRERFPSISHILVRLGETLYRLEHDLDWDLSGDSITKDDGAWEIEAIKELKNIFSSKFEIEDINKELDKIEERMKRLKGESGKVE